MKLNFNTMPTTHWHMEKNSFIYIFEVIGMAINILHLNKLQMHISVGISA